MKNGFARIPVATAAACALCAAVSTARADVALDAAQRASLGIETATLAAVDAPERWPATAQVIDPTPLIQLLQDLRSAAAAADASQRELDRSTRLHAADANVSAKAVESAQAQAVADAGHFDALRAQLLANWGRPLVDMSDAARVRLVEAVLSGRATLLRAETTMPVPEGRIPHAAHLSTPDGGASWDAEVLGPAARASGQTIGDAWLLRVDAVLQQGQLLVGELHDDEGALRGVAVPRGAIVRAEGGAWVYVEQPGTGFARRALRPCVWLDEGCLIVEGLSAGERVVTVGAELLPTLESGGAGEY